MSKIEKIKNLKKKVVQQIKSLNQEKSRSHDDWAKRVLNIRLNDERLKLATLIEVLTILED